MAKKSSAKASKKPAKSAKAAPRVQRGAAAAGAKPVAKAKYQQAGAPWWKQFLPAR
jgi:hypothetical protein